MGNRSPNQAPIKKAIIRSDSASSISLFRSPKSAQSQNSEASCALDLRALQCHSVEVMVMAANALVQTRVDGAVKAEAAAVLEGIGLTVSDAVRLLLTRVARDKALPFELLTPNAETVAAMKAARAGKVEAVTLDGLQAVLDARD
jgi:DNA-damage-inducible protein J